MHNTHILVAKHKFKIRALKGNPPPTKPLPKSVGISATLLPGRRPSTCARTTCPGPRRVRTAEASEKSGRPLLRQHDQWVRYHEEKQRELEWVQRQAARGSSRKPGSRLRLAQGGGSVLGEVWISAARGRLADEQLARGRCRVDLQSEGSLWHLIRHPPKPQRLRSRSR